MLFDEVAATSDLLGATSSRSAKRDLLAALLRLAGPEEIEPVVGFLVGAPRQGRIGVGWRTLAAAAQEPAVDAVLTVDDVDAALTRHAGLGGPGSAGVRSSELGSLLARATAREASFLTRLVGGDLRQGALTGVMTDAIAAAAEVPATAVRRAVMLGGQLDVTARRALTGGRAALEEVRLEVGRPLQPMLASTAASVAAAVEEVGTSSVEWKLDGIRIQVHRRGEEVRVWTRNLNEITDRLPGVVDAVRSLPVDAAVLDGEALGFDATGRPRLFQDSLSWREGDDVPTDGSAGTADVPSGLRPFFFDLLHLDGEDLVDHPLAQRRDLLEQVAGAWAVPARRTADPAEGEQVLADALAAGHEGVVVKAAGSRYEAGRRGKSWRKVKPVHTLDLVVLAVEWGNGRRQGWLSNLHLGARDPAGGFVMVGKTFKGMTDDLLRWQTERFLSLAEREEPWSGPRTGVVHVRPEQVVEIAVDGVQRSTRYPGGVALRFARVVRYRQDKPAVEADSIDSVRRMLA
ncbi:MAG: ATP-dependent DNA ligase [Microthrixaceae bacterium]